MELEQFDEWENELPGMDEQFPRDNKEYDECGIEMKENDVERYR